LEGKQFLGRIGTLNAPALKKEKGKLVESSRSRTERNGANSRSDSSKKMNFVAIRMFGKHFTKKMKCTTPKKSMINGALRHLFAFRFVISHNDL